MTPRPAGTTVPPATQDPVPCYNKIKPLAQKRSWTAEGKPLQDRVLMESTWDKIVEEFGSDNDAWLKVWLADPSEE